ncbi:protein PFC0760c-like [Syngnathus scovelli]|uniref:protein PFC0760c-like n=1 Tax=Syngnathus scovelli TaxID=161590 RepID=UPI0035CA95A3
MEGQGDGRHNGPNCYRIPLPIGNGARNMETLGLRVFILNQEIIFSIHAMIRPPDNDFNDGNTENNDEEENIEDNDDDEERIEDGENIEDIDQEENIEEHEENIEDEEDEETEESDGDADVEDNDGDMEDNGHGVHPEYHADNHINDMHLNDENAVLLFRIRVRPLQHGDVFDDIFLELRLVNNDDFDEIDNNEEHNGEANEENIDDEQNIDEDEDDGFENVHDIEDEDDDRSNDDRSNDDGIDDCDNDCNNDEGFEDLEHDNENIESCAIIANVVNEERDISIPVIYPELDDPLPGPSKERSVEDNDETSGGKQFQWWDDSNSDSLSDNLHEEEDYLQSCANKLQSSDDLDSQDDRKGKKTCKKNFLSKSEDEDFRSSDPDEELPLESSRKRPRGDGGLLSEAGRNQKRFRHGDASDSDASDDGRQNSRPASSASNRSRDKREQQTRDSEK